MIVFDQVRRMSYAFDIIEIHTLFTDITYSAMFTPLLCLDYCCNVCYLLERVQQIILDTFDLGIFRI